MGNTYCSDGTNDRDEFYMYSILPVFTQMTGQCPGRNNSNVSIREERENVLSEIRAIQDLLAVELCTLYTTKKLPKESGLLQEKIFVHAYDIHLFIFACEISIDQCEFIWYGIQMTNNGAKGIVYCTRKTMRHEPSNWEINKIRENLIQNIELFRNMEIKIPEQIPSAIYSPDTVETMYGPERGAHSKINSDTKPYSRPSKKEQETTTSTTTNYATEKDTQTRLPQLNRIQTQNAASNHSESSARLPALPGKGQSHVRASEWVDVFGNGTSAPKRGSNKFLD